MKEKQQRDETLQTSLVLGVPFKNLKLRRWNEEILPKRQRRTKKTHEKKMKSQSMYRRKINVRPITVSFLSASVRLIHPQCVFMNLVSARLSLSLVSRFFEK